MISDKAILYLDALSMTYFLHFGILEKLHSADFRLIVSPRMLLEVNELISYETISIEIRDIVEQIRFVISSRIESGKIKVGRQLNISDDPEKQTMLDHPTASVLSLARDCTAIIVDDRFLNQRLYVYDGNVQAPIFTTLDLINALTSTGSMTPQERLECRTQLRRAGYFFIPVDDDELATHLNASMIKVDKVLETAGLKAIRENILRIRMSSWIQLPTESFWLDTTLKVLIQTLKNMWKVGS